MHAGEYDEARLEEEEQAAVHEVHLFLRCEEHQLAHEDLERVRECLVESHSVPERLLREARRMRVLIYVARLLAHALCLLHEQRGNVHLQESEDNQHRACAREVREHPGHLVLARATSEMHPETLGQGTVNRVSTSHVSPMNTPGSELVRRAVAKAGRRWPR